MAKIKSIVCHWCGELIWSAEWTFAQQQAAEENERRGITHACERQRQERALRVLGGAGR
jgi:hypothetical protein